jgi:orotidine-5'-phosphate decarboxylase
MHVDIGKLRKLGEAKSSRIIVALDDLPGGVSLQSIGSFLEEIVEYTVGIKIGLPLVLAMDISDVAELIGRFKGDFYFLADFKLADIPSIVKKELSLIERNGFDGAILHLFPMGLEEVLNDKDNIRLDVFGLVAMSHPEARLLDQHFGDLLEYSTRLSLSGVVLPATKPELIQKARKYLPPRYTIISPGIGAQGAEPGTALKHGADFEIVGRMLTMSRDPRAVAEKIVEEQRRWLR